MKHVDIDIPTKSAYCFILVASRACCVSVSGLATMSAALRQSSFVGTPVQITCPRQVAPRINTQVRAAKTIEGKVVSASRNKTITVELFGYKTIARYGKRVKRSKKYHVHDENNECDIGDFVRVKEIPRMSKSKTMTLDEVIRKVVVL